MHARMTLVTSGILCLAPDYDVVLVRAPVKRSFRVFFFLFYWPGSGVSLRVLDLEL